jgi:hypothetical protein
MKRKDFFRAVNDAYRTQAGHIAGDSAISAWLMTAKPRTFTDATVAECVAALIQRAAERAARPQRLVFNPMAGDGFGLWQSVDA